MNTKVEDCAANAKVNEITMYKWLYGTGTNADMAALNQGELGSLLVARTGEGSLGAVPSSIILTTKVRFLEDVLNNPPQFLLKEGIVFCRAAKRDSGYTIKITRSCQPEVLFPIEKHVGDVQGLS